MWTNPNPNNTTTSVHVHNKRQHHREAYKNNSWEEQAFAEDATGAFGGCVWPPRSYSCNFCGREFRSAQALGGHMNVHRRDRARLKQSSPSPDQTHPSPVCALLYHHPNPNHHHVLASPTSDQKPSSQANLNRVTTDLNLSVSLNLVLHPTMSCHEDEGTRSCKKRRIISSSNQEHSLDTNLEGLDLELRLGGRPEVK